MAVTAPAGVGIPEEVQTMANQRKASKAHSPAGRRRKGATNSSETRKARGHTGPKVRVKRSGSRPKSLAASSEPRSSKQAEVIALLRRPEGATVAEVVAATGWQPHTVRGLFSGTLKKKLGLTLSSAQEQRGRVYRIIGTSGAGGAAEHSGGLRPSAADARSDG